EGYTDVIQMYQKGVKNVVSSSGTALTPEQIRLINRLTKNITVLFDGDAAGTRASLRGIDLILQQGMNVKVCTFPEGEDPDSFAKHNTLEEISLFLETNSQDFIQYKASLLAKDTKNDPIRKAETVRDIVESISKIPDLIKREIYIKECATIMDISESVLFSTLAQIFKKDDKEANKQFRNEQKAFEVVGKTQESIQKIDRLYELERKIIEILLLYGNRTEAFEDLILKESESGELQLEPVTQEARVFEKIYMDLQEDEMEFTNDKFKNLYYTLIEKLTQNPELKIEELISTLEPEMSNEVTSIVMDNEKYALHDWQSRNIYPKIKEQTVAQLVNQTILSLRCFLIDKKVVDYKNETLNKTSEASEILEDVKDYLGLKMLLSRKLGKVVSGGL
ncbi:MAG: toprim domain-containing protein, partial [Flavobacteriaceae bacterium]|nr:toprim domain-containing protein [Flavobacteriaceae bacterium]